MDDSEEVLEALDQTASDFDPKVYSIVDPEVRAYVYSLCSAVRIQHVPFQYILTMGSLEAPQPMKMGAMYLGTMHWPY